ncbi:efflux RND transporter periplasmic adaptor subunit [Oceanicaulis alexandrii]|uniref:efflux RND transporter periplasmic adaptor subunit n=1 Tax=Oceanicaulis alexandrii TaxID=153233 RepID=UPI0023550A20|nr:efflux RND transporter periplasmic adaptor subunit [Oceanicaulis alexandrii]|tara:strand:- start:4549 stop:6276 length:1728 start_codon:yes stop_codon:yes gene_type:complete
MKRTLLMLSAAIAVLTAPAPFFGAATAAHAQSPEAGSSEDGEQRYTCPMHPHYISNDPGSCPICGMDLVPMESGGADAESGILAGARPAVTISPAMLQTVGVRIAEVERTEFGGRIEAFAQIAANERLQSAVSTRTPGWIERLYVRAVGDEVSTGDLLFEFYSPELVAAQMDYFSARASNARRAEASLRRLEALGMGPIAIARMRERGEPLRIVPVFAERHGVVSEMNVAEGDYLPVGADVLTLQDYSTVWVIAEAPQSDLVHLAEGQGADVRLARGGAAVSGAVDYIYPTFDARTRTGRVRVVVPNPSGALRPGAFASVTFAGDSERRLAVPSEAVLYSEDGARVVVARGGGRFEPRAIETGLSENGFTEVSRGLSEGETVVASGQFLIDSESRLRESFARMQGADTPMSALELSEAEFAMVDHVVDAALYVHEALRDGYEVQPSFFQPAIDAAEMIAGRYPGRLGSIMEESVTTLQDLTEAETAFELQGGLDALVETIRPWLMSRPQRYEALGLSIYEADGRAWLEAGSARPFNPYGDEDARRVSWPEAAPEREQAEEMSEDAMRAGGGHANH